MHSQRRFLFGRAMLLLLFTCSTFSCLTVKAQLWSSAYYAAWLQGTMPASQVDYAPLTHILHFAIIPKADGTLNTGINGITPAYSIDLVTRAHAAGKKVLISVGGGGSLSGFQGASTSANRGTF